MIKWDNSNEEVDTTTGTNIVRKRKKKYHRPRLKVYGNLNRLTMGHHGSGADGGGPKASKL